MFEKPETAKYVLQVFLGLNDQMDESIVATEKVTSPEELNAFKIAVGHLMFENFERIIEPICKRHPSLKRPDMRG